MTEIEKPDEKIQVWCENCENWIHAVEDVEMDGTCNNCKSSIFNPITNGQPER